MDRRDCFEVRPSRHGERATYSRHAFRSGETVYVVVGEPTPHRTRETIEIGPGQHVHDPYALYLNHSFTPNLEVRGRDLVALCDIAPGDELTFNYLHNESEIASPFQCHETGRTVSSEGCDPPSRDHPGASPGPEGG